MTSFLLLFLVETEDVMRFEDTRGRAEPIGFEQMGRQAPERVAWIL